MESELQLERESQVRASVGQAVSELRTSSWLSWATIGLATFLLVASFSYSLLRLSPLERELAAKRDELAELEQGLQQAKEQQSELAVKLKAASDESSKADEKLAILRKQLLDAQANAVDFIFDILDQEKISISDSTANWTVIRDELVNMPSGKRKQAIITAILLVWKDLPFEMGGENPKSGFDSPRFLKYVLEKSGVKVEVRAGERVSDALMRTTTKVSNPQPGDLVFYKGQVGNFGLLYLSENGGRGTGIGIGTLQAVAPLQVISLDNINTPAFPLIGYFHVTYPDE